MCYHLAGENVLVLSDNICLRARHIIALQAAWLLFLWLQKEMGTHGEGVYLTAVKCISPDTSPQIF